LEKTKAVLLDFSKIMNVKLYSARFPELEILLTLTIAPTRSRDLMRALKKLSLRTQRSMKFKYS